MNLYKLTETAKRLQEIANAAEGDGTGGWDVEDVIAEAFGLLEGEIETKIDNCCGIIASWEAEAATYERESLRLVKLSKSAEKKAAALKLRMLEMMHETGRPKIKGALFTASIGKARKRVHVTELEMLSPEYLNPQPPATANKVAIAAAIKKTNGPHNSDSTD